jgi:hypothetical protein
LCFVTCSLRGGLGRTGKQITTAGARRRARSKSKSLQRKAKEHAKTTRHTDRYRHKTIHGQGATSMAQADGWQGLNAQCSRRLRDCWLLSGLGLVQKRMTQRADRDRASQTRAVEWMWCSKKEQTQTMELGTRKREGEREELFGCCLSLSARLIPPFRSCNTAISALTLPRLCCLSRQASVWLSATRPEQEYFPFGQGLSPYFRTHNLRILDMGILQSL